MLEKRYISRKQDAEGALSKTQDHDLQAKGWRKVFDWIKKLRSRKK